MTARTTYDQDVQPNHTESYCPIAKGVVGWESADDHHDLGSSSNDGHTFVRVTLFAGKHITSEPVEGKAQGMEILCKVMGPVYWVPSKGTPVLVVFPDGEFDAPGSAVIIGSIGPSPGVQFKGTKAKLDFGPDQDVVIKARSVTITDYDNNYAYVGKNNVGESTVKLVSSSGTGLQMKDNTIQMYNGLGTGFIGITSTGIKILYKDKGYLTIDNSGTTTLSGTATAVYGGLVLLGKAGPGAGVPVVFTTATPTLVPVPATIGTTFGATTVFISM